MRDRERETLESGLIQTAPLGHLISVSISQQLWEPDCETSLTHFPLCSIRTGKLVGHCIHPIQALHNLSHSLERRAFGEVARTLSGWFNCSHTQEVIHLTLTSRDKHIQCCCIQPLQSHLPLQWSMYNLKRKAGEK